MFFSTPFFEENLGGLDCHKECLQIKIMDLCKKIFLEISKPRKKILFLKGTILQQLLFSNTYLYRRKKKTTHKDFFLGRGNKKLHFLRLNYLQKVKVSRAILDGNERSLQKKLLFSLIRNFNSPLKNNLFFSPH